MNLKNFLVLYLCKLLKIFKISVVFFYLLYFWIFCKPSTYFLKKNDALPDFGKIGSNQK